MMLDSRLSSSFPEVYKLILLFVTIPVTVATVKRSFSKLKLMRTYLRSAMSQEWFNNLGNTEAKMIVRPALTI